MFIPLGDDNSQRRSTPVVVYAIMAANAYMWFLQLTRGEPFTNALSTVPYEITHHVDLAQTIKLQVQGQVLPLRLYPSPDPISVTIFSAMFMHGSWMHIIGNMVYLGIFGDQIEDYLGHFKFLLFYLLCGIGAALAHVYADPNSVIPSLGASGAIAGVLGAYLALYPRNRVRVMVGRDIIILPAIVVLGFWIVLQVIGQAGAAAGQASGVAYMAHIGGFVAGMALLLIFRRRRTR
ncbi:MAG: rhomboid family intramembrane serine protease [Oligoflexia bacterium]|nr:rhomboid family intramembrane serine protease [Oligoflexia bacterium]